MNLGLFQGLHQRVSRSSKTNKNSQMTERENPERVNLEDGIPMGAGAQGAAAGGVPQDGGVERRDGPPRDGDGDVVRVPHEAALARTRRVTCAATTVAIVNATAVLLFWSSVVAVGVRNQSSSLQIDQSIQRAKGSIGDIQDAIKVVYKKLDGFYKRMDGVESRISAVEQASVFQKIGKRRPRREIREWKLGTDSHVLELLGRAKRHHVMYGQDRNEVIQRLADHRVITSEPHKRLPQDFGVGSLTSLAEKILNLLPKGKRR